jgi:hypothetical protein
MTAVFPGVYSAAASSCVLFGGGSADIDEHNKPSKVEMTPLWRLFDRS